MDITDEGVVIADKDYALRQISLDGVSTTLIADLRSVGGAVVPDPRVGLVATRDDLRFTVDSKSFVSARDGSEVEMLDPSWNPGLMTRRHDDLVVGQLGQSLATWSELGVPPEVFLAGPDIGDGELSTAIHHVSVGERFVFFVAANCALGRYPLPAQYQR